MYYEYHDYLQLKNAYDRGAIEIKKELVDALFEEIEHQRSLVRKLEDKYEPF